MYVSNFKSIFSVHRQKRFFKNMNVSVEFQAQGTKLETLIFVSFLKIAGRIAVPGVPGVQLGREVLADCAQCVRPSRHRNAALGK